MFIIGQLRNGGAERVIYNLCTDLKKEFNITLVVRSLKDVDLIYVPDVKIIEVNELSFRFRKIIGIIKIRKLKKKLKIDTSISFHLKYNIYNYLSKYKDKIILSIRNYTSMQLNDYNKFQLFIYKKILKQADLIVNVSKDVMKDQISLFNTDINKNIVIPNYVEIDKINTLKKEKINLEKIDQNTILTVGRLCNQKGMWHLIKSMKKIIEFNSSIKLVIIGRGPLKQDLINLIHTMKLDNNVFIIDFKNNVYQYMYNAKLFVLTSRYEGMPNVLLECLACDLPIIATDSFGGTKEILSKKYQEGYTNKVLYTDYGILIPNFPNDYNLDTILTEQEITLANTIINLINNPKMYQKYKDLSNKRIKDFQKEKILKLWKSII